MSLKGKLRRLETTMRGQLNHFELRNGRRYYFDPGEAAIARFLFLGQSITADYKREPRPEPPEILKAVAGARDRSEALNRVMGGYDNLPIEREALVERGEFVPRSLVAGKTYEELLQEDKSE